MICKFREGLKNGRNPLILIDVKYIRGSKKLEKKNFKL